MSKEKAIPKHKPKNDKKPKEVKKSKDDKKPKEVKKSKEDNHSHEGKKSKEDNKSNEAKKSNEDKKSKEDPESKGDNPSKSMEQNDSYLWMRSFITHLSAFMSILGILYLFVGICALIFYKERLYETIFGSICLLQISSGLLLYFTLAKDNPTVYLVASLLNLVWIVASVVLFMFYRLWMSNEMFENDVVFQFGLLFYVFIGAVLVVSYFLLIQALDKARGQSDNLKVQNKDEPKPSKGSDSKEKSDKKDNKAPKADHKKDKHK